MDAPEKKKMKNTPVSISQEGVDTGSRHGIEDNTSGSRHGIEENASEQIAATDGVQRRGNLSNVSLMDTNPSQGYEEGVASGSKHEIKDNASGSRHGIEDNASGSRHGIEENASERIAATNGVQRGGNLSNVALTDTNPSQGYEECFLNTEDTPPSSPDMPPLEKLYTKLAQRNEQASDVRCRCKGAKTCTLAADCLCAEANSPCTVLCNCNRANCDNHCGNKSLAEFKMMNKAAAKFVEVQATTDFTQSSVHIAGEDVSQIVEHRRGCNCRKSSCMENYCQCFKGGVGCSPRICKCLGCKNVYGKKMKQNLS